VHRPKPPAHGPRRVDEAPDAMTDALARLRADVTRDDVLRAIQEYDRLGPERFFSEHGFGPSRSYELVWDEHGTRTKRSWAQRMNSPRASTLPPAISRAGRAAPSRCSGNNPVTDPANPRYLHLSPPEAAPWTERGPALMIANRPQIDRPRPPARLLRAGLFVDGRPLPGIADGRGP
jgi:hypothetical protein